MKKYKLLKFDIIHPPEYLAKKKKEWDDLEDISLEEYRDRLIKLRSNYSDFYTWHLNQNEDWNAEEFFLLDSHYLEKTAKKLFGSSYSLIRLKKGFSLKKRRFSPTKWRNFVIDRYIQQFKPDVIFVRSQPVPSNFWQKYRNKALLVSRLSARLPQNWHPNDWDLIYTDQPDFKTFFDLHGVRTIINKQGFDKRVVNELDEKPLKENIVFVGGLGTENFLKRTNFINSIATEISNFKWWGYWWEYGGDGRKLVDFPALNKSFNGLTSGLEMLQIYKDSFAVVNDYVDTANGIGFNQRMFEVMGAGGFLITRDAPNFKKDFPENIFATYQNEKDLLEKIEYYKRNPEQRDLIAKNGQKFVLDQFDYKEIVENFEKDLLSELESRSSL